MYYRIPGNGKISSLLPASVKWLPKLENMSDLKKRKSIVLN